MTTGFIKRADMLEIEKDSQATLIYTFDWVDWLDTNDQLATATYSVQARLNDPNPIQIGTSGIQDTKTYVELSGGQVNKTYTVTASITTTNNLIDRRNFRVYVTNRSA